jgi:hypothetical protein
MNKENTRLITLEVFAIEKKAPLANYTFTENVINDPEIKSVVSHMSKILIAARFLLLLTTKLNNSKWWKCHIQRLC